MRHYTDPCGLIGADQPSLNQCVGESSGLAIDSVISATASAFAAVEIFRVGQKSSSDTKVPISRGMVFDGLSVTDDITAASADGSLP